MRGKEDEARLGLEAVLGPVMTVDIVMITDSSLYHRVHWVKLFLSRVTKLGNDLRTRTFNAFLHLQDV